METELYNPPFTPVAPDFDLDWLGLDETYPWIRALQDAPQSPVFHQEGNAWVHTRMVLEALTGLESWQSLDEQTRIAVYWATVLHDVAKPACTEVDETGRITSHGHAVRGERMAREIFWKGIPEPMPFAMREKVVKMVRYHMLPYWAMEKSQPEQHMLRASVHCDLQLLSILARADVMGRICDDQDKIMDKVNYFQLFAEELGVFGQSYPFPSDLARYAYFSRPGGNPAYDPFDDSKCEVTLLAGLPGTGKDHWVKEEGGGLPVISLDTLRQQFNISPRDPQGKVFQAAKEQARVYLRKSQSFIWNATNITRSIRKPLIDLFRSYKAKVKIVYLEVPYKTLLSQNKNREHPVPNNVLQRYISKLEVPGLEEAPEVQYQVVESRK